jgi:hypothetical protein
VDPSRSAVEWVTVNMRGGDRCAAPAVAWIRPITAILTVKTGHEEIYRLVLGAVMRYVSMVRT